MTIFKSIYIALSIICLTPLSAFARAPVPIVNYENVVVVTASGNAASAEQVRQAFLSAGIKHDWTFAEPAPNQMIGTLNVRDKHTIKINILYSGEQYSVTYRDSVNMKYGLKSSEQATKPHELYLDGVKDAANMKNSVPVIHPFYNSWVKDLLDEVHVEFKNI